MSEFITDVEQQYEVYCKIAEEYGFIDLNAKKSGFRCTTKSNEFNAGWIAFTGAIAAMRDEQQAKIDRLNSVLDERTKEWLQAIECGTYFENVAKPLKAENDELQKRIDRALFEMQQLSLMLSKDMDGYKDPVQLCQSEGFDMCVKILEKALRGEHE